MRRIKTHRATVISRRKRAYLKGDTRPTLRRLGFIATKLRSDLCLPATNKLGAELECSYKTIARDLDLLRDFFGYPLEYDARKYVWKITGPLPEAVL